MLRHPAIIFAGCLLALLGCSPANDLTTSSTVLNWAQFAAAGADTTQAGTPTIRDGSIRLQVTNQALDAADIRVTMRVTGDQVHFSTRQIPAQSTDVIIGPDRADSVLVEITLLHSPPILRPSLTYFYGQDYQSGDTINVIIAPEPEQGGHGIPGEPNAPAGPPTVTIEGLDTDIRVRVGTVASFAVRVNGTTTATARVDVFADADQTPGNGDETPIATDLTPVDRIPIQWTVPELPFGRYFVYAEVRDGTLIARAALPAGAIRIDAPPQLTFDSPRPSLAVTRGRNFIASWAGSDSDDNAVITIFLDTNTTYEGTEPVLRSGIAANDLQDRQLTIATGQLALGTYYVGGLIDDGLGPVVAYAGPVCVTSRLVGRVSPSDLDTGAITTITGGAENRRLGAAVDISRRLSPTNPSVASVLLADPGAVVDPNNGSGPVAAGEVCLYQHTIQTAWPRQLTINDMSLRMIGEESLAATGHSIALLAPVGLNATQPTILVGAPGFVNDVPPADGRAYLLDGQQVLSLLPTQSVFNLGSLIDSAVGTLLDGQFSSATGAGVAALGDIDGSGRADFAIGATNPPQGIGTGGTGLVFLFPGSGLPFGPIALAAKYTLFGADPNDLTGYAITGVADANSDGNAELAIGAPLSHVPGSGGSGPRPGVAYLVFGRTGLLGGQTGGSSSLAALGDPNGLAGLTFVGENDGDQAGAALASGDFDGDGKPDLLIGAPGFDGGRGRVYLIYNVGDPTLPQAPQTIALGLVGSAVAGTVFDGLAPGDQLGFAVARAGDFDLDGLPDLLLGAPGVEAQRGGAYLIYGQSPRLQGHVDLTALGTCGLPSLEFVGDAGAVSRLGEALSVGDLLGDGHTDLAIGAPGDGTSSGQVHLLFGHPTAEANGDPPPSSPGSSD